MIRVWGNLQSLVCYDCIMKCFMNLRKETRFKLAHYLENSYNNSRMPWFIETGQT